MAEQVKRSCGGSPFPQAPRCTLPPMPRTLALLALSAVLAFAWWPATMVGRLGDDFEVLRSVTNRGPFGMWCGDATGLLRPLASASAWVDGRLGGASAAHAHSLVLYALCVGSVCLLARRLDIRHAPLAALLFAALGSHAEPVAWLASRADLLATTFVCGALALLLVPGPAAMVGCFVAAALALASKESAVCLPLVALALEIGFARPSLRTAGLAGLTGAWLVVRHTVLGTWVGGYGASALPGPDLHTLTNLTRFVPAVFDLPVTWGVAASTVIFAIAFAAPERRRAAALVAAFLLAALPVAGMGGTFEAGEGGRLHFLPGVFLCFGVATGVSALPWRAARWATFAALILAEASQIRTHLSAWRAAGDVAERYVARLSTLPRVPDVAVAAPAWIGPACALCTGADAAAALRLGDTRPGRIHAVALYRAHAAGCVPAAAEERERVRLILPPCGTWEPSSESLEGVTLTQIDDHTLELRGTRPLYIEGESGFVAVLGR